MLSLLSGRVGSSGDEPGYLPVVGGLDEALGILGVGCVLGLLAGLPLGMLVWSLLA